MTEFLTSWDGTTIIILWILAAFNIHVCWRTQKLMDAIKEQRTEMDQIMKKFREEMPIDDMVQHMIRAKKEFDSQK